MRNVEEHKKLLKQISELEKNSVNYFDVEKEFFLIDSDNLHTIQTRLYGYSIQATGIYEEDNLTEEAAKNLDGRGCYVYVEVKNGKITIKQDINGCWGIYLFRHGDYFALSNSFFRLLDHVKYRYPLTVNRDYCHYLMVEFVAVQSYSQTAVNEIQFVARNAVIHADILKKNLEIELIDYKEHSVPLDSERGIKILDRWVEFWGNLFRNLAQRTNRISADLTGGFDTRIHFVPLLNSGIDLNQIRINSKQHDTNPVIIEDYAIASEIAEHYGFKLNNPLPTPQYFYYSLQDTWNCDLYSQQTARNLPSHSSRKGIDKTYALTGVSGEVFRETWHMPPQRFIARACAPIRNYSSAALAKELNHSIQTMIKSIFDTVCDKFRIEDPNSVEIPQYLYHETRSRNHCGKAALTDYLKNVIMIVPAYDPEMQTLQLKSSKCPDYNLLMILLFTRYAPDLLNVRFDKFHDPIDLENLIPHAREINERFPLVKKDKENVSGGGNFSLQPRDLQAEKIIKKGRNNRGIPSDLPAACLKAIFESSRTYGLFTEYFDEELYQYAASFYDTHPYDFSRSRRMYAIVGVTKVLEDVEISQSKHSLYRNVERFLEQDFCKIPDEYDAKAINKFKNYFTARLDIKLMTEGTDDFQIVSVSDDKAKLEKPAWLNKNGIGYVIHSYFGNLEIVAKATSSGKCTLKLRGTDTRESEDKSKRIPYWIDYTKLILNEQVIFDTLTPAWHDKPYIHNMEVKAGDEIKIQVEWLPHRSDT